MNNAGIDLYGDVEFLTLDLYRRVADVNLFGTISVTKTFLPLIRKSKGSRLFSLDLIELMILVIYFVEELYMYLF